MRTLETNVWRVTAAGPRWAPVSLPPVAAPGSARIVVDFAGICGSDLPKLAGHPIPVPASGLWQPGHEIVGRTLDGHPRQVVVNPLHPCRNCAACMRGATHLCAHLTRIGWDLLGGFTELLDVPATALVPLPAEVTPVHGVIADAMAVAIHGIRCCIRSGDSQRDMAVIGSGQIALCTAVAALAEGWDVTLLTRTRDKREALCGLLPITIGDSNEVGQSFDCVVDAAAGHRAAPLETALRIVRDGGQIIVQNAYHPGVRLGTDLREVFHRSITLTGAFSFCQHGEDFARALDHLRGAPTWLDALTACHLPMEALPDAIDAARAGAAPIKTILTTQRSATS
jgi:threonine dehydrogenase-like Zn-dependent dehydrogenase